MATKRNYLTIAELEEYADITVTDETEAFDQISQAEEIIDSYVGPQQKAFHSKLEGLAAAGSTAGLTLSSDHQNVYEANYLIYCICELIGGTGVGQQRRISASTKAGVLTLESSWDTTPDTTSFYRIYQLAKFPRYEDMSYDSVNSPPTYYKFIPESVKRAVAAQIQYMIEMGTTFFDTDKSEIASESIGDYSYSNRDGASIHKLIAPKAKLYLRGIYNRKGAIILT